VEGERDGDAGRGDAMREAAMHAEASVPDLADACLNDAQSLLRHGRLGHLLRSFSDPRGRDCRD
jgi:hypothetical protein